VLTNRYFVKDLSDRIQPSETDDKPENLNQLQVTVRPELVPKATPEIFISYALG
jgi:hypothetical protein